jgi:DNA polymerase-3 subunit gamma/tau
VEVGLLLDQLVGYFRDVMASAVGCGSEQLIYALPSQSDEVAQTGRQLGLSKILAIGQILDQTAGRLRVSMHGRTLVEMAVVRICHLDELDDLAAVISDLRPAVKNGSPPLSTSATSGVKKNAEPRVTLAPAPAAAVQLPASTTPTAVPAGRRIDPPHAAEVREAPIEADISPPPAIETESFLAQWQRAVADGAPARTDAAPRVSRREQLAEVAEQPFVRRAMELFDVPAGQLRYTPPGDAAVNGNNDSPSRSK